MQPWLTPFPIWNQLTYNVDLQFVNFCCIAKWFSYTRNVISEQCFQYWIPWTIPKWVYILSFIHTFLRTWELNLKKGSTVLAPASHGAGSLNICATGFLVSPLRRSSSQIFLRRDFFFCKFGVRYFKILICQCPGRLRNRQSGWLVFTDNLLDGRQLTSLILERLTK